MLLIVLQYGQPDAGESLDCRPPRHPPPGRALGSGIATAQSRADAVSRQGGLAIAQSSATAQALHGAATGEGG